MSELAARPMPLFYRKPETNAVAVAAIEFASAMRHYPIVFSDGEAFPVAVLGRESAAVADPSPASAKAPKLKITAKH